MRSKVIPCLYAQMKDSQTQKLADLKERYALTQSQSIKTLLDMAENLIFFNKGSKEDLVLKINQIECPTEEERVFFFNLKVVFE